MLQCKDCGKFIRSKEHARFFKEWFLSCMEQRCMIRPQTVRYKNRDYYELPYYCGTCIERMRKTWKMNYRNVFG